jgi:hypothetical protein
MAEESFSELHEVEHPSRMLHDRRKTLDSFTELLAGGVAQENSSGPTFVVE